MPCAMAYLSAARSTPVWPPDTIFRIKTRTPFLSASTHQGFAVLEKSLELTCRGVTPFSGILFLVADHALVELAIRECSRPGVAGLGQLHNDLHHDLLSIKNNLILLSAAGRDIPAIEL